jgi:hypothetical protein
MLDLDGSPPPSLPQRVDELMELLRQEQHARMHLERRLSEESSPISIAAMVKRRVEAAVEERLEMAVLQLRADFAAEFPAYRRSSYQMHAEREQEQLRAVEVIAEDAYVGAALSYSLACLPSSVPTAQLSHDCGFAAVPKCWRRRRQCGWPRSGMLSAASSASS